MPQLQAAPVREQKTRPNRPKRPHRPDDGTGEQSKRTKSDSKKREIKGCRSVLKVFTFLLNLIFTEIKGITPKTSSNVRVAILPTGRCEST